MFMNLKKNLNKHYLKNKKKKIKDWKKKDQKKKDWLKKQQRKKVKVNQLNKKKLKLYKVIFKININSIIKEL